MHCSAITRLGRERARAHHSSTLSLGMAVILYCHTRHTWSYSYSSVVTLLHTQATIARTASGATGNSPAFPGYRTTKKHTHK